MRQANVAKELYLRDFVATKLVQQEASIEATKTGQTTAGIFLPESCAIGFVEGAV